MYVMSNVSNVLQYLYNSILLSTSNQTWTCALFYIRDNVLNKYKKKRIHLVKTDYRVFTAGDIIFHSFSSEKLDTNHGKYMCVLDAYTNVF